jgi:hypothetical protein
MLGPLSRSVRLAAGLIAVALFVFAAQAQAATFTVGATDDNSDCASPPNGNNCTLRQLVSTVPAGSTITVPAGTYSLTGGELSVAQNMTIVGAGARTTHVQQQTANSRVFDVQPGVTSTISGLDMFFGKTTSTSTNGNFGGDVQNRGTLTLSEDFIELGQTTGGFGGGIANLNGTLIVTHSLIQDNSSFSGGQGGALYNDASGLTARTTIDNSTIVGNTAAAGGGAIFTACTRCSASTVTITSSTIATNDGGTAATNAGGLLAGTGSTISAVNTIVANNTVSSQATPSNCAGAGTITSLGHNLESGSDCGFRSTGDLQNTNPKFLTGGVSDSGGNTDTIALDATSPAVDGIPVSAQGCEGTDQRDIPRPQGAACDIGAFEVLQPIEGTQFSEVVRDIDGTSATINWGDGTSSAATVTSGRASGTHTYAEAGVHNAVLTWINSDHLTSTFPFQVKVADAPLAGSPSAVTAVAGMPFTEPTATFTDDNPLASAADFTAAIDWGDGSPSSAGSVTATASGFVVNGTHTYAKVGSFATTISIVDTGGSNLTVHGTATAGTTPSPVTGNPPSVGGTTAAFTGSVNPSGLPTTARFQYGLDPRYTGGGPIVYSQSTPAQPVGSDFTGHTVSASVTGLVPNAMYHVRLVATNSAGTAFGPDVTFNTHKTAPPGAPTLGQTFNVSIVNGVVLVKIHGIYVPLTQAQQIPKNTLIDALHGTLQLTTALPGGGGAHDAAAKGKKPKKAKTQSGTFGGAIFKIAQARNGLATLSLVEGAIPGGPSFGTCKAHKTGDPTATSAASKTLQLLHASAKGKFRTRGRYSAATIRGTKWTVADRCDGTLTRAITHSVVVTDFIRHKTIVLHAGQSYLAPAHRKKSATQHG